MCGRFALGGEVDFYAEFFGVDRVEADSYQPSFNVAPTHTILTVEQLSHDRVLGTMTWGFLPPWTKNRQGIQINARLETIDTKKSFAEAFARRRCIIPADGFYEWQQTENARIPHWIYRGDGYPIALAGIWGTWRDPKTGVKHRTCAIITTSASGIVSTVHDRMPVILDSGAWDRWLDRDLTDPPQIRARIRQVSPDSLMAHPVSNDVNSVTNNHRGLTYQRP